MPQTLMTDLEDLAEPEYKPEPVKADRKPEKRYPSLELSDEQIEGIGDYKVGDKCFLCFEGEVEATRSAESYERLPKGAMKIRFKLKRGTVVDSKVKSSDGKNGEAAYKEAVEEGEDHKATSRMKSKMKDY